MISRLSGTVVDLTEKYTILDVSGVGYKIFCSTDTLATLSLDTLASLHTHLAVREDALDLYGFSNAGELHFFRRVTATGA